MSSKRPMSSGLVAFCPAFTGSDEDEPRLLVSDTKWTSKEVRADIDKLVLDFGLKGNLTRRARAIGFRVAKIVIREVR
jgi:hypothetical protein